MSRDVSRSSQSGNMTMSATVMIQDRRCFRSVLALWAIMAAGGLIQVLVSLIDDHGDVCYRMSSLVLFVVGSILFLATERATRPLWNHPARFLQEMKHRNKRPTTLFCLDDSLTQGSMSANFVDEIVPRLCEESTTPFTDSCPLRVTNGGQNSIATWTTCQERIDWVRACRPDYVLIMIGSNDVRCLYKKLWAHHMQFCLEATRILLTVIWFVRFVGSFVCFIFKIAIPIINMGWHRRGGDYFWAFAEYVWQGEVMGMQQETEDQWVEAGA